MAKRPLNVWIVDDDQSVRWVLEKSLKQADMETRSFERAEHLLEAIAGGEPDVLITDVRMPGMRGLALLDRLRTTCPDLPIIVITAHSDLENAVAAYKGGAFEYLPKPFDIDEAVDLVHKAARLNGVESEADEPPGQMASMIGQAPAMQEVFRYQRVGLTPDNKIIGHFTATGVRSHFSERFRLWGYNLPASIFEPFAAE